MHQYVFVIFKCLIINTLLIINAIWQPRREEINVIISEIRWEWIFRILHRQFRFRLKVLKKATGLKLCLLFLKITNLGGKRFCYLLPFDRKTQSLIRVISVVAPGQTNCLPHSPRDSINFPFPFIEKLIIQEAILKTLTLEKQWKHCKFENIR